MDSVKMRILRPTFLIVLGFWTVRATSTAVVPQPQTQPTAVELSNVPKRPVITDQAAAPKKSAWVRTKKHLKRYWRRYAIATAAILIAIDQLRSQRVNKTKATEQLTSLNPPSPLERLLTYQRQLILRVLAWSPKRLLRRLQQRLITLKNRPRKEWKNRLDRWNGKPFDVPITEIFALYKGARVRSTVDGSEHFVIKGHAEQLTYDFFEGWTFFRCYFGQ